MTRHTTFDSYSFIELLILIVNNTYFLIKSVHQSRLSFWNRILSYTLHVQYDYSFNVSIHSSLRLSCRYVHSFFSVVIKLPSHYNCTDMPFFSVYTTYHFNSIPKTFVLNSQLLTRFPNLTNPYDIAYTTLTNESIVRHTFKCDIMFKKCAQETMIYAVNTETYWFLECHWNAYAIVFKLSIRIVISQTRIIPFACNMFASRLTMMHYLWMCAKPSYPNKNTHTVKLLNWKNCQLYSLAPSARASGVLWRGIRYNQYVSCIRYHRRPVELKQEKTTFFSPKNSFR